MNQRIRSTGMNIKNYLEMVRWVVDNNSRLRYYEWPALLTISEAYGVSYENVQRDVQFEAALREKAAKEQRKAASRASNEQRRLANLALRPATDSSYH